MADCDTSLLKFESIILDENLNPSNKNEKSLSNNSGNEGSDQNDLISNTSREIASSFQLCDNTLDTNEVTTNNVDNDALPPVCPITTESEQSVLISYTSKECANSFKLCDYTLDLNETSSKNLKDTTDNSLAPIHSVTSDEGAIISDGSQECAKDLKVCDYALDVNDIPPNNDFEQKNNSSCAHDDTGNSKENSVINDNLIQKNIDFNLSSDSGEVFCNLANENNFQMKDEEFHDAAQFFDDPSSLNFLEKAGSTSSQCPFMRSSLYVNFDPLHAKSTLATNACSVLKEIPESVETETPSCDSNSNAFETVNKHLFNNSIRESVGGNILISFDSPITEKTTSNCTNVSSPKLYTEEEFANAKKVAELKLQEEFLKRQRDLELETEAKQKEAEIKIIHLSKICDVFREIIPYFLESICSKDIQISAKDIEIEKLKDHIENVEKDNIKLKEDLKTSAEDLQSVENTFSDFHKRYEQCKSMLKVYSQNEDKLKQQLDDMERSLRDKDEMYKTLENKTEEMLEKANIEVANARKSGDGQIAVLKAQLKRAEMKISSLESDLEHVNTQKNQLSNICDELMTKVSNG